MALTLVYLLVLLVFSSSCAAKKRYDGYQLVNLRVANERQRDIVRQLANDAEIDVWAEGREELDILVPPTRLTSLKQKLTDEEFYFRVKIFDIQRHIDGEEARLATTRSSREGRSLALDYDDFNTYEDISDELDALVARCPSGLTCETVVHGVTYEGRDIKGIRVYRTDVTQKKIWIDATIHAREWLATAVNLKIISTIVDNYSTDAVLLELVDRYDWYLLPILNPDGYAYTWSDDRLWRKNRSPNEGSVCMGTDLNRNFDHMWGNAGSSPLACQITFRGPSPGSEAEVQALSRVLTSMSEDLLVSINLHTYGRMWLMPWGYENPDGSCYVGPDHDEMMIITNAAANAVEATYNTVWTRGPFCSVLYPGSGTSIDYGKGVAGLKYTFLPELRGNNFVIAKTEIHPAFLETWNGVQAAIAAIERAEGYYV